MRNTEATMRPALCLLAALAVGLLAVGCSSGPPRFQTRGRVLKDGQPFHPPGDDVIRVTLMPITEDGGRAADWYVANFNREDATFRVVGKDGRGVPPGKYRVGVEQVHDRDDVFKGAYFGDKSPYVREIHSAADEITIDLAKRE
jgi:hypothetical protein